MCSQVGRCLCFVSLLLGVSSGNWAASIYTFTTIDYPDATSHSTVANGINDAGQIVGYFNDSTGKFHGFLKDGATFTTIDVPGANATVALGINDAGQIVGLFENATGTHGFLKDGATFTTIDVPDATFNTFATGINNAGEIVGYFRVLVTMHDRIHGFLKDGATFTTIDVPGASATFARGINDAGQIVGFFQNPGDHGFLKDGAAFATIDRPGAIATDAIGINDAGQIVGLFLDDTVQTHGFVATPVPELATWLQFGSSLMGLLWGGRQATGRNLISA